MIKLDFSPTGVNEQVRFKDGGRTGIFDRPAFVLQPTMVSDRGEIRIY